MDETTPITTASTTPGGMTRAMSAQHELELRSGSRFDFGRNWLRFVRQVDRVQIEEAETELRATLGSLENQTFLDFCCGGGLCSSTNHHRRIPTTRMHHALKMKR